MKRFAGIVFAAVTALFVAFQAAPVRAAVAPVSIGKDLAATQSLAVEDVRWGGRGGGGWGHRGYGHRAYGHRGFHARRFYGRPVYARRHVWRPHRVRPVYYAPRPAWRYHCVRSGWVFNGWRYVWRRYRVC